jgi:hypothetical protein
VRVLAAVAVIVGAVGLVVQRRRIRAAGAVRSDPTVVGVRAAATIMAVVTLVALAFAPPVAVEESEQSRGRGPADRAAFGGGAGSGVSSPSPSFGSESLIRGGDLLIVVAMASGLPGPRGVFAVALPAGVCLALATWLARSTAEGG